VSTTPSSTADPAATLNRPTWLPNALVWLRLVLAGVFVGLLSAEPLASKSTLLIAAGIFIFAALTDMLDGKLARAWDCVSRFGRIMDSFADKILVLGAFVVLAGPSFSTSGLADTPLIHASGVYPWMAVVILGRELLITSLRGLVEGEGGDFSAIWAGKWKMVAQSVAVPLILVVLAWGRWQPGDPGRLIIDITAWATVVITVLSAIPYIRRAIAHQPQKADA
jgi:CDP-diacylglycerol--glycerol-3-phosphate 3-phosphatidyltransferase